MTYGPRFTYTLIDMKDRVTDWAHAPDPMVHSWRWRQPEAAFYVAFYDQTNAMVRQFRDDLATQLFA